MKESAATLLLLVSPDECLLTFIKTFGHISTRRGGEGGSIKYYTTPPLFINEVGSW